MTAAPPGGSANDLSRRALALSFDPKPKIVPLDQPQSAFDAVAIVDDDATPRVAPNLSLLLSNEKKELRRMNTDASGRAHFVVSSSDLGPPGPGELHVTFAGDGETAKAHHVEAIERHVKVSVRSRRSSARSARARSKRTSAT